MDGFDDIDRIDRLAAEPTPVLLRVSPGIESHTHAALATGGASLSKFGIGRARAGGDRQDARGR